MNKLTVWKPGSQPAWLLRAWVLMTLSLVMAQLSQASVTNPNPNLSMSVVGDAAFTLHAPSQQLSGFAVRVVDASGAPIPGLTVRFFNNYLLCFAAGPPCSNEADLYGDFWNLGVLASYQTVLTDNEGMARSELYIGGLSPGSYDVAASIADIDSAKNAEVLAGNVGPSALFDVVQDFAVPPGAVVTLDGYMSGNWYDPHQGGQGFQLEFTDDSLIAIWFVFTPDGTGQNWIYAQGPYDLTAHTVTLPAEILSGTRFPPLFKSADVHAISWGTVTFTFIDCSHGTASWNSSLPNYGSGSMPISRLTQIRGSRCPQ